jgi:hypothetical protein
MPTANGGRTQEARSKQSAASKRATFEKLTHKPRAEKELTLYLGENGKSEEATLLFRAINTKEYDKLLGKYPPKPEQRAEGANYNIDAFGPALISRTLVEPELDEAQVKELWNSEDWSRGEIMTLFSAAVEVCMRGLDIPFTERG